MRRRLLAIAAFFAISLSIHAQTERCGTMELREKRLQEHPELADIIEENERALQRWISDNQDNRSANVITIPVVVHVIEGTGISGLNSAQVRNQIETLNEDFRLMNEDSLQPNHAFWPYSADTQIEFCLATVDPDGNEDPNGNPNFGIRYYWTTVQEWDESNSDGIKDRNYGGFEQGGADAWDPTKYLNIWVANFSSETEVLGYATFPDELATDPDEDGVVIRREAFGSFGTAGTNGYDANNKGRTLTHEVGHWLGLRHIWGDENCGDDLVSDTPSAEEENYGCPTFPHRANNTCGGDSDGEMYMNYMDYVNDECMVMFTFGQADRMLATLNGPRSGLLTSNGCGNNPSAVDELQSIGIKMYPNPTNGTLTIENLQDRKSSALNIYNMVGELVWQQPLSASTKQQVLLSDNLTNGMYQATIVSGKEIIGTQKLSILK